LEVSNLSNDYTLWFASGLQTEGRFATLQRHRDCGRTAHFDWLGHRIGHSQERAGGFEKAARSGRDPGSHHSTAAAPAAATTEGNQTERGAQG
jgi:hypothetical protein